MSLGVVQPCRVTHRGSSSRPRRRLRPGRPGCPDRRGPPRCSARRGPLPHAGLRAVRAQQPDLPGPTHGPNRLGVERLDPDDDVEPQTGREDDRLVAPVVGGHQTTVVHRLVDEAGSDQEAARRPRRTGLRPRGRRRPPPRRSSSALVPGIPPPPSGAVVRPRRDRRAGSDRTAGPGRRRRRRRPRPAPRPRR